MKISIPSHPLLVAVMTLCVALTAPTAHADDDATHVAAVTLKTFNDKIHTYKFAMDSNQAWRLETSAMYQRNLVTKAKRKYARKQLGYEEKTHGRDAWKMVPGLRVYKVSLYSKTTGEKIKDIRH